MNPAMKLDSGIVMTSRIPWETIVDVLRSYASEDAARDQLAQLLAELLRVFRYPPQYQKYFRLWEAHDFHVTPVHFYSPIPDTRTLTPDLWEKESELAGVDMNDTVQLELLRNCFPRFRAEYDRFPMEPQSNSTDFYFANPMFSGTDALALYCMVRHYRPKRVIEIGSGLSSRVTAQAARMNGDTELVCIEPYPTDELRQGIPGVTRLVIQPVQCVGLEIFKDLGADDILFIDSSHVVKTGGDVNYLFLEVLPRLNRGVIVHVHDIFFPMEMRPDWLLEELRFWTEQYLLQAFLIFNDRFEVLLCNSYLGRKYPEDLKSTFPNSPWWGGGSFWMRRKLTH